MAHLERLQLGSRGSASALAYFVLFYASWCQHQQRVEALGAPAPRYTNWTDFIIAPGACVAFRVNLPTGGDLSVALQPLRRSLIAIDALLDRTGFDGSLILSSISNSTLARLDEAQCTDVWYAALREDDLPSYLPTPDVRVRKPLGLGSRPPPSPPPPPPYPPGTTRRNATEATSAEAEEPAGEGTASTAVQTTGVDSTGVYLVSISGCEQLLADGGMQRMLAGPGAAAAAIAARGELPANATSGSSTTPAPFEVGSCEANVKAYVFVYSNCSTDGSGMQLVLQRTHANLTALPDGPRDCQSDDGQMSGIAGWLAGVTSACIIVALLFVRCVPATIRLMRAKAVRGRRKAAAQRALAEEEAAKAEGRALSPPPRPNRCLAWFRAAHRHLRGAMGAVESFGGSSRLACVGMLSFAAIYISSLIWAPSYKEHYDTDINGYVFAPISKDNELDSLKYYVQVIGVSALLGGMCYMSLLVVLGPPGNPYYWTQAFLSLLFLGLSDIVLVSYLCWASTVWDFWEDQIAYFFALALMAANLFLAHVGICYSLVLGFKQRPSYAQRQQANDEKRRAANLAVVAAQREKRRQRAQAMIGKHQVKRAEEKAHLVSGPQATSVEAKSGGEEASAGGTAAQAQVQPPEGTHKHVALAVLNLISEERAGSKLKAFLRNLHYLWGEEAATADGSSPGFRYSFWILLCVNVSAVLLTTRFIVCMYEADAYVKCFANLSECMSASMANYVPFTGHYLSDDRLAAMQVVLNNVVNATESLSDAIGAADLNNTDLAEAMQATLDGMAQAAGAISSKLAAFQNLTTTTSYHVKQFQEEAVGTTVWAKAIGYGLALLGGYCSLAWTLLAYKRAVKRLIRVDQRGGPSARDKGVADRMWLAVNVRTTSDGLLMLGCLMSCVAFQMQIVGLVLTLAMVLLTTQWFYSVFLMKWWPVIVGSLITCVVNALVIKKVIGNTLLSNGTGVIKAASGYAAFYCIFGLAYLVLGVLYAIFRIAYMLGFALVFINIVDSSTFPVMQGFDAPYKSFLGMLKMVRAYDAYDYTLYEDTPSGAARRRWQALQGEVQAGAFCDGKKTKRSRSKRKGKGGSVKGGQKGPEAGGMSAAAAGDEAASTDAAAASAAAAAAPGGSPDEAAGGDGNADGGPEWRESPLYDGNGIGQDVESATPKGWVSM